MKHIGEVVRVLRKQSGLTLIEVAASIQESTGETYDNGNLSKFERGMLGISPQKLEAIAAALGTTVSQMYRQLENNHTVESKTPSRVERLLGEIRSATRDGLTEAEEQALSEGLKAQLTWLKANRQPQQNIDMATGNPDATKLIDQYVKTAADSTPESMNLLKRQLDAQHEKQKTTGEVSNDEERQGDRSTGT